MKKLLFSTLGMVLLLCLALTMTAVADPDPGIVGLWHFDEIFTDGLGVQTTPDSSGQGNTGTLMPLGLEPALAPGKFNMAPNFNGTNQWIDCEAKVDDSITTELTLAAWIKDDGNPENYLFIISNDYTHGTKKGYDFFLWPNGRLYADVGTGVLGRVSYLMPGDTLWHHVAVTWDGSTVTLYVDGNSVGTTPLSGTYQDPGKNTYVGKFNWPVNYNPHGKIDDVRIYDHALTPDEIDALASQECVAPPDNLISWWPGDGNAEDFVGDNDGVNSATFVPGMVGDTFTFSGTGSDYVRVSNDPSLEPETVTVDAWVRAPVSPGSARYIVAKGAQGCTAASYALYTSGGGLRFYVYSGIGSGFVLSPYYASSGIWDGQWHHVAGTYDGTAVRLYVDGAQVGSGTSTSISIGYGLATDNDLIIGQYTGTCSLPFNGDIDEVEIFNRALSLEEIQGIYLAGSAGKCINQPPVAICKDIEIPLVENCGASIVAGDVDGGSYDPDEGDTISLSVNNTGPFSPGVYLVYLTVTDESGESDTCQAEVTVTDTTPPIIESFTVDPNILRPPNHKMVLITPTIIASDNCDPEPGFELISITMNEGDETLTFDENYDEFIGAGHTTNDIQLIDGDIYLRAERSGKGDGRIYFITYEVTDASGNSATVTATVTVPHDQK